MDSSGRGLGEKERSGAKGGAGLVMRAVDVGRSWAVGFGVEGGGCGYGIEDDGDGERDGEGDGGPVLMQGGLRGRKSMRMDVRGEVMVFAAEGEDGGLGGWDPSDSKHIAR